MGIEIGIAAIGLGVASAGTYVQYNAAQDQKAAATEALDIQRKQERLRARQMQFDAMRKRREIIRTAIQQRAYALASTTQSGASTGSALPGAYGQISGTEGTNTVGVNVNEQFGQQMFNLNSQLAGAYRNSAIAAANEKVGAGLTTLGGAMMTNAGQITKIGSQIGASFGYRG